MVDVKRARARQAALNSRRAKPRKPAKPVPVYPPMGGMQPADDTYLRRKREQGLIR